jgi:hypothetical protein
LYFDEDENEDEDEGNHDPCCPKFDKSNGMWNFHQTEG